MMIRPPPRRYLSFLLNLSTEFIETRSCKNQSDLANVLNGQLPNKKAFEAFSSIDRALFLPDGYREPYVNRPQNLGFGNASMSTPYHHSKILSILHENGLSSKDRVLDLGCGSGYLTAAFYKTVGKEGLVIGVERIPELVNFAKKCLEECPVTTGAQKNGSILVLDAYKEGETNWNENSQFLSEKYDFIHVGFSFEKEQDESLIKLLSSRLKGPNSRILAGYDQYLCLFDHKGYRIEIEHIPGLATIQKGKYVKPISKSERIEILKTELENWKTQFENKHKRKPNREDMFHDSISAGMFKEFSELTKLSFEKKK